MKNPSRERQTTNMEMVCHLEAGAQVVDGDACKDAVCVFPSKNLSIFLKKNKKTKKIEICQ